MKHVTILTTLLLSFGSQADTLKLELYGKGLTGRPMIIALFNSEEGFLKDEQRIRVIRADALSERVSVLIQNLEPGKYVVATFADNNQNGKLDTNFLGMPTELYGFSNNARGRFGPPAFSDAAFELNQATTAQSIHLH